MIFSNGSVYYGSRASGSQPEQSMSSQMSANVKNAGLRQLQNGLNRLVVELKQDKSSVYRLADQKKQKVSKSKYPSYGFFFPNNQNLPSRTQKQSAKITQIQGELGRISQRQKMNEKEGPLKVKNQICKLNSKIEGNQPNNGYEIRKEEKKVEKSMSLVEENISLGKEVHQLQDKYAKALGQINRLLSDKNEADNKIENSLLQRVKQIDQLRINYAKQKQKCLKLQIKLNQLQMELKQKKRELEALRKQDQDYSSTYFMMQQKCKQMIRQNERICKIYEEFELTSNEQRQSLTCRTSELERKIGKKQGQIRQLKQKCIEQQGRVKNLEKKRQQLQDKVKQLDKKCIKLQSKIVQIEQRSRLSEEKTTISIRTISGALNCKQQQIQNLTEKHRQQVYKLSLHMNELRSEQERRVKTSEQKLVQSSQEIEKIQKQLQRFQKQSKIKISEIKIDYQSRLKQLQKRRNEQKSKLQLQNHQLKLQITEFAKKNHEKQKILLDLHQTLAHKTVEYNKTVSQMGQQFQTNRKLKQEIKRFSLQQQQFLNRENNLRFLLEQENRRKRAVQLQLCEVTNNFHEFYNKVDEKVVVSDQENRMRYQILKKQYEKELAQLQRHISSKQQDINKIQRENGELKSQVKSIRVQLQNYQGMYQILSKKLKETTNVVNLQQSHITKKDKSIKLLQRELESIKIELKIMKEEKQRNEANLNNELDKRKEMIESLIKQKKMLYCAYDQNLTNTF